MSFDIDNGQKKLDELHTYWFSTAERTMEYVEQRFKLWFLGGEEVDLHVKENFVGLLKSYTSAFMQERKKSPRDFISWVVLHDQVPRNAFRGTQEMYAYDETALALCLEGIQTIEQDLNVFEKAFLYLPLEHSEDLAMQETCIKKYTDLVQLEQGSPVEKYCDMSLEYAEKHYDIIKCFGRFPHRNQILGRTSTQEEIEFLKRPGSSF